MHKTREDRLAMAGRVSDWAKAHVAMIAVSEVAAQQTTTVITSYEAVNGARGGAAKRTRELTTAGNEQRKTLQRLLTALQGPLTRVATRLNDGDLLASATLTAKSLRKLRPAGLRGVAAALLKAAARPDVASELAKQGLTAAALAPLQAAYDTYAAAQPKARRTIDERVVAGEKLETLVDALMKEIYELDDDMKAFALLNPDLLAAYKQARKIIDTGARPGPGNAPVA
jgi:hypothetical protein